jgi:hypothetical protein
MGVKPIPTALEMAILGSSILRLMRIGGVLRPSNRLRTVELKKEGEETGKRYYHFPVLHNLLILILWYDIT